MAAQKPTLSIFTGSKNLGSIFSEQNQITVKFFEQSIPFTGADGRLSLNVLGKQRIIILQGAHDGTGFTGVTDNQKLKDFVYDMEEWVNAKIQTSKTFYDSFGFDYSVDAVDWSWVRSINDPNRILYTLLMKETVSLT